MDAMGGPLEANCYFNTMYPLAVFHIILLPPTSSLSVASSFRNSFASSFLTYHLKGRGG